MTVLVDTRGHFIWVRERTAALGNINFRLDLCLGFWHARSMTKPKSTPEAEYLRKVEVRLILPAGARAF